MSSDDGPPGSPEASFTDIGGGTGVSGGETDDDRVDLELKRIRDRRINPENSFMVNTIIPQTFDDYTLVFGLVAGAVFFGSVLLTSSGLLFEDSITLDDTVSGTFLDPSDCIDMTGEIWFEIGVDQDQDLHVHSQNAPTSASSIMLLTLSNGSEPIVLGVGGMGDLSLTVDYDSIAEGGYDVTIEMFIWTDDSTDLSNLTVHELTSLARSSEASSDIHVSKEIAILLESRETSSLWGSTETHKKMEKFDDSPRACWTVQQLGGWGWVLMGAEWVGGRETAMLTGGSFLVPPWYMAIVSLGMSIFFLCVQYPLMHRLYHRDADDLLSSEQMRRLIGKTVASASERLHIRPDYDSMLIQDRAISVDVYLTYRTTRRTIVSPIDVKATIIKDILSEFSIFGEMRPLQIKTVCTDSRPTEVPGWHAYQFTTDSADVPMAEDYSDFFARMGRFGNLEEAFHESMARWFKKHDVADYGAAIMADEDAVFARVIYRPVIRFAYFLFKPTYEHLQRDLRQQLQSDLGGLIDGRTLVVSARNEKSTIADRAVAGRVEQGTAELAGEAMVARRGGIPGALLQNPFMGDILSSVEYVAHKNRSRIDRYGFWGLIVFVWIPFMASGVLVGAMLGLVARMRFRRVLAACFIGGTAASVTWAYTARGIIEFMERYHAEAFIPFVILLAIAFTWLKIRDNKRYRREELFRDSMAFFAGAAES
ncbi:MAG: small multi-drug export protein [Candidatus Thalassarchaeaceae archaeon]|jgi:hypothetical protein|nr:small multi-drug export protein [Candidatus Thalassarchaeaceae archaeon]MDP7648750.1 small multi-drug export protein [Candidatus Thalassarchaeaceae archaeon]HJL54670.1 small multi-drug export protein [Candidatus Thalassarchaeaceae archaeon]